MANSDFFNQFFSEKLAIASWVVEKSRDYVGLLPSC